MEFLEYYNLFWKSCLFAIDGNLQRTFQNIEI